MSVLDTAFFAPFFCPLACRGLQRMLSCSYPGGFTIVVVAYSVILVGAARRVDWVRLRSV